MNAHEVFSDANRKSHMQPHRLSPAQIAELELVAAQGIDNSDEDDDELGT